MEFDGTWEKCRTGLWLSHTRMTTLPFLLLALSPFVIFGSDYAVILCPLCMSITPWNIFMILSRNVEQDKTTCRVQEWQLWLCNLWSYLPLFCFLIWFRDCSVTRMPFGIFWWDLVELSIRTRGCVLYKNDNSTFLTFGVISCYIWQRLCIDFVSAL